MPLGQSADILPWPSWYWYFFKCWFGQHSLIHTAWRYVKHIEQHLLQTSMVSLNCCCWWIGKMMTVRKHGQGLLVWNNHARMVLLWYMFQSNHQYMRNISLVSWALLQSNHWCSTKCSRHSWIACSTPVGLPICLTGLGCSGFHS